MPPLPGTVIGKTCEGRPVTSAEIEAAAKEMQERLQLMMTTGACSAILVN
jgi:hypothetical protein